MSNDVVSTEAIKEAIVDYGLSGLDMHSRDLDEIDYMVDELNSIKY